MKSKSAASVVVHVLLTIFVLGYEDRRPGVDGASWVVVRSNNDKNQHQKNNGAARTLSFVGTATTAVARTRRRRHRQQTSASFYSSSTPSDTQPSYGLYEVQEEMLVKRGIIEEELMRDNYSPLEASNPRGAGTGGFGAGGGSKKKKKKKKKKGATASKSASKKNFKLEAATYAAKIRDDGVVRIDNVLDAARADELRKFAFRLRRESDDLIGKGEVKQLDRFADVLLRTNRCDLKMPLGPPQVNEALYQVLCQSAVAATINQIFGNDAHAVLYELSCLISDPGSQRQVIHPDNPLTSDQENPVLLTCFIALQDIHLDMGPTVWLPGTNTVEAHTKFNDEDEIIVPTSSKTNDDGDNGDGSGGEIRSSPKDELLKTTPAVLGTLKKGCCAIYDSRVLHGGTSNKSANNTSRALFYFSFRNPDIKYPGNPASIRSNLLNANIEIGQLVHELMEQVGNGKKSQYMATLETEM